MPLYGKERWDGIYIISQILAIQCWYYFIWALIHCIVGTLFGLRAIPIMEVLFNPNLLSIHSSLIYVIASELVLVCVGMSILISVVVERSRKCWDYCTTIYIIHLFLCLSFYSFPSSLGWWCVNGSACILLTMISERICVKREMEEIPVVGL